MDFFAEQQKARSRTGYLIALYVATVVLMVAGCVAAALLAFGQMGYSKSTVKFFWIEESNGFSRYVEENVNGLWFGPESFQVGLTSAAIILFLITAGTAFKMLQLRRHGAEFIARNLGCMPANRRSNDPGIDRFINIVTEMAIASGMPMPRTYVMEGETSINAFAAGTTPSNALIAVTRGTLDLLDRDELQAVVAHEFSHILNGDVRVNMNLTGVLYGLMWIRQTGYLISKGNGKPIAFIGLVMLLLGAIGHYAGLLIQAMVSRQREYLADASAVQFTRTQQGLVGALAKIGTSGRAESMNSPRAEALGHFLFSDGSTRSFAWLATHPSIPERIKKVVPAANVDQTLREAAKRVRERRRELAEMRETQESEKEAARRVRATPMPSTPAVARWNIPESTGNIDSQGLDYAKDILASLPPETASDLSDSTGASIIALAAVTPGRAQARDAFRTYLASLINPFELASFDTYCKALDGLPIQGAIDVLHLTTPELQRLDSSRRRILTDSIDFLHQQTENPGPLQQSLHSMVRRALSGPGGVRSSVPSTSTVEAELSVLAILSAAATEDRHAEFDTVFRHAVEAAGRSGTTLLARKDWHERARRTDLGQVLPLLSELAPYKRQRLVRGCEAAIVHDGRVNDAEAALIRAVCDGLDCPVPPILYGGAGHIGSMPVL